MMTREDLAHIFQEKLRQCGRTGKYRGQFTPDDEKRAIHVFRLVIENPTLSDHLILEQLTGERETITYKDF